MDHCITVTSNQFSFSFFNYIKGKYKITESSLLHCFFSEKQKCVCVCHYQSEREIWINIVMFPSLWQIIMSAKTVYTKEQNQINSGSTHLYGIIGFKDLRALLKMFPISLILVTIFFITSYIISIIRGVQICIQIIFLNVL